MIVGHVSLVESCRLRQTHDAHLEIGGALLELIATRVLGGAFLIDWVERLCPVDLEGRAQDDSVVPGYVTGTVYEMWLALAGKLRSAARYISIQTCVSLEQASVERNIIVETKMPSK